MPSRNLAGHTLAVILLHLVVACQLPRDPGGTLERVEGGTMRAGFVPNPPWVLEPGNTGQVGGIEGTLAQRLAVQVGASVTWIPGTESQHLENLKHGRIDLLIAGLTDQSPVAREAGMTRPYYSEAGDPPARHLLVAPPGENAWIMRVERSLAESRRDIPGLIKATP